MTQPASLQKNIINLLISQGVSFLVPLLQFPLLARVLGVDEFGLFIFSYSLILFLMVITNYGFELYLPAEMAHDQNKTNELFTHSIFIRLILFIICIALLIVVSIVTDYYDGKSSLLAIIGAAVFFNSFNTLWIFQGKEQIYLYSRCNVVIRTISLLLIFLLVTSEDDLPIALLIVAINNGLILLFTLFIAYRFFSLRLKKVKLINTVVLLKNSFQYFLSRLGVSLYAVLGGFIIGTFSGSLSQVAY